MADRSAASATRTAPKTDHPSDIRNVVLIGPSGSGKTTLAEALLHASGTTSRVGRVENGATVSDHDDAEVRQGRSVNLAALPFMVGGVKVNLLDTPGYADFVGELRAGLRAADAALFVVSALEGVDELTQLLWEECATVGMPRAIAVTKIDHHRAGFEDAVEQCQAAFGANVLPAYYPVTSGEGADRTATGLVGLLSGRYYDYTETRPAPTAADAGNGRVAAMREALLEGVIQESEDETLMERYMAGAKLDPSVLVADLETAVARGSFYPVLAVSALGGVGVHELMGELPLACPSPVERPFPEVATPEGTPVTGLGCDPNGPLLAEVVQTLSDPYVGRVSLIRVFSGTLRPDSTLHVSGPSPDGEEGRDLEERVGALFVPLGKHTTPAGEVRAGDVCVAAKLTTAETGDTLSGREHPLRMPPWTFPEPLLPTAVEATMKSEEDKLAQAVARLTAEDVTARVETNPETHQLVLWTMGEAHLDIVLDRLRNRHGVSVTTNELRVPLRETFSIPAQGTGRNVKQSGGHGEYGVCRIRVEPLPPGTGLQFVDNIVGGVVPRQYVPSVEKGIRAQMASGLHTGHPLVDIRVTLYDGKSHSVDSSDMAFQKAGKLALRDAANNGELSLLEPVDEFSVLVPDSYMGAVMSDLSARRGRVVNTEAFGGGRTLIRAEIPQLETTRYAVDLRSLSHGTGSFTRRYLRHEVLPPHLVARYAGVSP